ncbi:transposase [Rhodococcus jostii]|uniref:transposase n=1 Tax=Rhodococcus jostii TaxID=132919 RepID=UPI003627691A
MAIEMIDELIEWGRIPPVVVADAGYGDNTAFFAGADRAGHRLRRRRQGRDQRPSRPRDPGDRALQQPRAPADPRYRPHTTCKELVVAAGRKSLRTATWRKGSKADPTNPTAVMRSRFAVLRARPANRDIPRAEDGTLPAVW